MKRFPYLTAKTPHQVVHHRLGMHLASRMSYHKEQKQPYKKRSVGVHQSSVKTMKKTFFVFISASLGISAGASTIRGSLTGREGLLQNFGKEVSNQARALVSVTLPPATADPLPFVASEAPSPTLPSEIQVSSHVVQWGSAKNGCNYTLPPITISCGAGGTIALGPTTSSVKGCISRSGNTLVCSSLNIPTVNPQVAVTCSGTTTSQLAVSVQIAASQTSCNALLGNFPQSKSIIRGGATTVLALLGRYCKSNQGSLYLNTNYTCGAGDRTVTQPNVRFCTSDGSCTTQLTCNSSTPDQSCPGSCISKMAAVTVSDQDARSECINVGPRSTPLPAGLHSITWRTFRPQCSGAASTVTASCGFGGLITFASSTASKCNPLGDSLTCTKNATTASASVVFYCYGTTEMARTASAFLPKSEATNCNTAAAKTINVASQAVILQRFCGNRTLMARPSKACGKASQLLISKPNDSPVCISSNQCNSTSKSSCSIPLDYISVSDDASNDPTCIVLGPKSLNF